METKGNVKMRWDTTPVTSGQIQQWTQGLAAIAAGFMDQQHWQVQRCERATRMAEGTLRSARQLLESVRQEQAAHKSTIVGHRILAEKMMATDSVPPKLFADKKTSVSVRTKSKVIPPRLPPKDLAKSVLSTLTKSNMGKSNINMVDKSNRGKSSMVKKVKSMIGKGNMVMSKSKGKGKKVTNRVAEKWARSSSEDFEEESDVDWIMEEPLPKGPESETSVCDSPSPGALPDVPSPTMIPTEVPTPTEVMEKPKPKVVLPPKRPRQPPGPPPSWRAGVDDSGSESMRRPGSSTLMMSSALDVSSSPFLSPTHPPTAPPTVKGARSARSAKSGWTHRSHCRSRASRW